MPWAQHLDHPLREAMDDRGVIDPHGLSPAIDDGMPVMRQSTIGDYLICPNRIKFKMEHPGHYGGSDATVIGTAYHAGLELVLYSDMIGEDRPSQEDVYGEIVRTVDDQIRRIGMDNMSWAKFDTVDELKDTACQLYDTRMHYPLVAPQWEIVGIEVPFMMPWIETRRRWAATGTIDLVLWHPVEGYRIVDHKTAGRMWQSNKHLKSPQPHWYAMNLRSALATVNAAPAGLPMDFEIVTYGGKFERRTVTSTPATELLWHRKANVAAHCIETNGPWFENTDSNLCSPTYCDAWEWCPSGASYRAELALSTTN